MTLTIEYVVALCLCGLGTVLFFFVRNWISKSEDTQGKLVERIEKIQETTNTAIRDLTEAIHKFDSRSQRFEAAALSEINNTKDHVSHLMNKMTSIEEDVEDHELRIQAVEQRCDFNHGK